MADFILGRLKFHFKGDWVTATAYIKDDVVRYGGNSFVAMQTIHLQQILKQIYLLLNGRKCRRARVENG